MSGGELHQNLNLLRKLNKSLTQTCHPPGWVQVPRCKLLYSFFCFLFFNYHEDVSYFTYSAKWIIFSLIYMAQIEDLNAVSKPFVYRAEFWTSIPTKQSIKENIYIIKKLKETHSHTVLITWIKYCKTKYCSPLQDFHLLKLKVHFSLC